MQAGFPQKIKQTFHKYPDAKALWIKDEFYTYHQLSNRTGAIVQYLKVHHNESLIGILTHDTLDTYAAFIATWFCGIGFVPLSPSYPEERINDIVEQAGIKTLIISKEVESLNFDGIEVLNTEQLKVSEGQLDIKETVDPQFIACMLFTSGSTGQPKGVPMTYENVETTLDAYKALNYGPDVGDRCLQMFEFTFDMSLLSYLPAFLNGACVYSIVDDKYRFMTAFKVVKEQKLTHTVFVPSTLAFMQRYFSSFHFPDMMNCMVGGEPFNINLAQEWQKCVPNCRLVNISGPTETTMACMGYKVPPEQPKQLNDILAFGKPWKNTMAIVVNDNLEILPPFKKGELCFAGKNVMKGYWKNPEKNSEVFFDKEIEGKKHRFYATGDGAYMDNEGDFFTTGRIDYQVKIQGYRVEPGEIESLALQHCGPCLLVAIPYQKHEGFYSIQLFIEQKAQNQDTLMDFLKAKLPPYMVPERVNQMESLPLNRNGKIDRALLKQNLENGAD